jgi:hypothetical protein
VEQLALITADLDTLRDANVIEESERNPEFRRRLAAEVEVLTREMERTRAVVDSVVEGQ